MLQSPVSQSHLLFLGCCAPIWSHPQSQGSILDSKTSLYWPRKSQGLRDSPRSFRQRPAKFFVTQKHSPTAQRSGGTRRLFRCECMTSFRSAALFLGQAIDSLPLTGKGRISLGISVKMQQTRIGNPGGRVFLNQEAGEFCTVEAQLSMQWVGR